jgi:hypothetical protein
MLEELTQENEKYMIKHTITDKNNNKRIYKYTKTVAIFTNQ